MQWVPDFNNRSARGRMRVSVCCAVEKRKSNGWLFNGIFTVKTFVLCEATQWEIFSCSFPIRCMLHLQIQ